MTSHDGRSYRVFQRWFDGDVKEDTVKFSCGTHLADVVDLVQGESTRDVEVEGWDNGKCEIDAIAAS